MRNVLLAVLLLACTSPKAPPAPPANGACSDGALLDSKEIVCGRDHSCTRGETGLSCVARAEGAEACGLISCAAGCSCATHDECMCPHLGPPQ
jgi:hypothetical protein